MQRLECRDMFFHHISTVDQFKQRTAKPVLYTIRIICYTTDDTLVFQDSQVLFQYVDGIFFTERHIDRSAISIHLDEQIGQNTIQFYRLNIDIEYIFIEERLYPRSFL